MEIYLPIAGILPNILLLLIVGFFSGILSGLFGIGGLYYNAITNFYGRVTSCFRFFNQIVATSVSAFIAHARRKNVDFHMGAILIIGGFMGSSLGIWIFQILSGFGQIDLVISLSYIVILGFIGVSMAYESVREMLKIKSKQMIAKNKLSLADKMPYKVYFARSNIEISIFMPIIISFFAGILVSIMGIGGGFIMIPAMIYILRMPTNIVIVLHYYK